MVVSVRVIQRNADSIMLSLVGTLDITISTGFFNVVLPEGGRYLTGSVCGMNATANHDYIVKLRSAGGVNLVFGDVIGTIIQIGVQQPGATVQTIGVTGFLLLGK